MFGLALSSMAQKAPTFDEQGFLVRGLGYLRGENRVMRVGHPLGLNALNAAPLVSDPTVRLPTADPSWTETSFHRPAELFLWEIGNDVAHVMFLARLPTIWLGLLLAALVGRWAWAITRRTWAGLLALALLAFDPNILAHTRLTTTDLGLTAAATLAAFTLWRYWRRPSWGAALLAGAAFGLLQNTKFTAGLFVPLFALVVLAGAWRQWRQARRFPGRALGVFVVVYPLAAFFTLWAAYGFQVGPLPQDVAGGAVVPLSHHLEQLLDIGGRLQVSTPSFLLGQYSDSGWWYYFPVAFLLKTPLPTLLLLLWALFLALRRAFGRRRTAASPAAPAQRPDAFDYVALLIPALGYFAFALTTEINLGYRHILPVLPFLFVFTAVHVPPPTALVDRLASLRPRFLALLLTPQSLLLVWLLAAVLFIYPDFLAFFNVLAGGPDNGWRSLVDSNLDWGQDLDDLPAWMAAHGVERVWLSYFGEARPEYYGIDYVGLDSFPPRLMNPETRPFYPPDPAPGVYAISATNLQGVHFADPDQFAWFRERDPRDKLGYSIFLYDVAARGDPVALLLSGVQIDEIAPQDFARLGSNDVTPRWVDVTQSLIVPAGEPVWLAKRPQQSIHPLLRPYFGGDLTPVVQTAAYELLPLSPVAPAADAPALALLADADGRVRLDGAEVAAVDESGVTLQTTWTQLAAPRPLKIFIHAVDAEGEIVTQWDGIGAAWEGWRRGDTLMQIHELPWSPETPAGAYELWAGLYHPQTGARWQNETGDDRVYLGSVIKP